MNSLQRRLVAWLVGLLTVVGLGAGGVSYVLARNDANALLDQQLRQIARHVGAAVPSSAPAHPESDEERENDFVVQAWDTSGALLGVSRPGFVLARKRRTGFSWAVVDGQRWRVYTRIEPSRTVQVSQWVEVRREIGDSAALRAMLSVIVLIPLAWVLVVVAIGRILRPLGAVTTAASQRGAASLEPLPVEGLPAELVPLVQAMNDLLSRLRDAIESQREFLSDAAHELRTPLAALQLQLENLSSARTPDDADACVEEMRRGLQRASRLVGQLLSMARFEASPPRTHGEVALGEIVKQSIAGLIPLAGDRRIDLGMVSDEAATIVADASDVRTLVDNLIDNAVRYTPPGGRVDVGVARRDGRAVLSVADSGPGITPEMLPRIFDRFFRAAGQEVEGSGIGLAIVKAIAEREGAKVEIANRTDGNGLLAQVEFNSGA